MPHVVVKLYSAKSERQKQALAQAITDSVTSIHAQSVMPEDLDQIATAAPQDVEIACMRIALQPL